MSMRTFAVGHRVVVTPNNAYDVPEISPHFGKMAGHYGKVDEVTPTEGPGPGDYLVGVVIMGRIDGQPVRWDMCRLTLTGQRPRTWFFFPHELEHAD